MSKQVCEYRVICEEMFGSDANIEEKVNVMIKEGWQPLGSAVPLLTGTSSTYLVQTMVRYEE